MNNPLTPTRIPGSTDVIEHRSISLNNYTVPRIVYHIIKNFMIGNTPDQAGVRLVQTYDPDYTKSQILLDMGYHWRTKDLSKVPAIFIQREDATYTTPTMGQHEGSGKNVDHRVALCTLPVTVSCVAAEPIAVVENLAEYVKQPLLYFRNEVQLDFGFRRFQLMEVSKPKLVPEGKNNFFIDITMKIVYDDNWNVRRDSLKLKHLTVNLFDQMWTPLQTLDV